MTETLLVWIREHGPLGIALFLAFENLGIPWPTVLAYLAAVELVRLGELSWTEAVVVCTAGHMAGSLVGYALGLSGENALVRRARRGGRLQRTLAWLHVWFERYGVPTIAAARMIGYVRPWASIAAGLAEVRLWPFLACTIVGTLAHVGLTLWLVQTGVRIWDASPRLRVIMLIGVALVFAGAFIYALVHGVLERRKSTLAQLDIEAS